MFKVSAQVILSLFLVNAGCATASPDDASDGKFFRAASNGIENSWIVVLNDPPETRAGKRGSYSKKFLRKFANDVGRKSRSSKMSVDRIYNNLINGFSVSGMTEEDAREFARDERVAYVEQNGMASGDGMWQPENWGLDRIDERKLPLDGCYDPKKDLDGSGVTVYIIDSGIRISHSEFEGRARWGTNQIDGLNFIDDDCNGHGTHVAGIVGGKNFGVAKNVELVAVKVLGCDNDGPWDAVIDGIEWVERDAKGKKAVANLSLGGRGVKAVDDAVKKLVASGVPTTISAGNDDEDACDYTPAREESAITVGAMQRDDKRWKWSNYGDCIDIFAPGVDIRSAWKDSDTDDNSKNGTSMAAPHVAGVLALHLQDNATPSQAKQRVLKQATSNRLSDIGKDSPNELLYIGDGKKCKPPRRAEEFLRRSV